MANEEIITKILGEHTEEQGKVANRVLSFVAENPDWKTQGGLLYKSKVLNALNEALTCIYGHDISFFATTCRMRWMVDVRYAIFLLLREEAKMSLTQIGDVLGKNHSTVLYGLKTAKDLLDTYRPFREDYNTLKNYYLSLV